MSSYVKVYAKMLQEEHQAEQQMLWGGHQEEYQGEHKKENEEGMHQLYLTIAVYVQHSARKH